MTKDVREGRRAGEPEAADAAESSRRGRAATLRELEAWTETPLAFLGLAWLGLVVVELVRGTSGLLEVLGTLIWAVFLADFGVKLALAPRRLAYLESNWLTALSLALPALRVLRFARALRAVRAVRAARGLQLVRVVGSINRGMGALRATLDRRGFGYVSSLTVLVVLAGAAGMYAFEREAPGGPGFADYVSALWWTAMLMTTVGSEYWPQTAEGRALCLLISVYAIAVFGYVAATLASFFIDRDAESGDAAVAGAPSVESLRSDLRELRDELARLRERRG